MTTSAFQDVFRGSHDLLKIRFIRFRLLTIPDVHFTLDSKGFGWKVLVEKFGNHGDTVKRFRFAGLHQLDIKRFAFPAPDVFQDISSSFPG